MTEVENPLQPKNSLLITLKTFSVLFYYNSSKAPKTRGVVNHQFKRYCNLALDYFD